MKRKFWGLALAAMVVVTARAQEPIYRCGNEYTNAKPVGRGSDCKLVAGGNVTVVPGTRVPRPAAARPPAPRGDAAAQARDADARLILLSELQKAQARRAELEKEYNNGEPEKRGEETRNHQKYLDRVADLKANLARNASDIAGIQRELERLPGAATAAR